MFLACSRRENIAETGVVEVAPCQKALDSQKGKRKEQEAGSGNVSKGRGLATAQ